MTDEVNVNPRRPNVSGLSPKDGTPGTQVTIRGENLGTGQNDLISLLICGVECIVSARWETPSKIIARVGRAAAGSGEVIVTTKSGGRGVCVVNFRVYTIQIGPLHESAIWVDESRTVPGREPASVASTAALVPDTPLQIPVRANNRINYDMLQKIFPDGGGNMKMENFVPAWYLLEHHKGATIEELKQGLAQLKAQSKSAAEGPRDVIKNNLSAFMACIDSLHKAQSVVEEARTNKQWPLTTKLEDLTTESHKQADILFSNVLSRKDQADATRNALSVLTRYQFLFNLPANIDKRVQTNEYSAILSDYTRAKSLYGDSKEPLFQEAMAEIEKRMENFKQTLCQRLVDVPATLEQHRKTIKYLLHLEPDSDPGVECLEAQQLWLENQLWDLQEKHNAQARQRAQNSRDSGLSSSDPETNAPSINQLVAAATTDETSNEMGSNAMIGELPERYEFVESVLMLLAGRFRDLQLLANAYIDGSLSTRTNLHQQDEIQQLLSGTITLASWLMLNAIMPDHVPNNVINKYDQKLAYWPPHQHDKSTQHELGNALRMLRNMRACIAQLCPQSTNLNIVRALIELTMTLRIEIVRLCTNVTVARVFELEFKENWRLHAQETEFARTQLPSMFEATITEVLPVLRVVVSGGHFPEENNLSSRSDETSASINRLLQSFRHTLFAVVKIQPPAEANETTGSTKRPDTLTVSEASDQCLALVKDRRVLMTLANCDYALRVCVPTLVQRMLEQSLISKKEEAKKLEMEVCTQYNNLRLSLLQAYINVKCRPIAALIHEYTDAKRKECIQEVFSVSNYIKDTLLFVVNVHAELFLNGKHFTPQVMESVTRECAHVICQFASGQAKHDNECQCHIQCKLDILALDLALNDYFDIKTKQLIQTTVNKLSLQDDDLLLKPCLREFQQAMRLTLIALRNFGGEEANV